MNRQVVKLLAVGLHGLDADLIQVEVTAGAQPGPFQLKGLPEGRERETRVRVRAALQQIGLDPGEHAITVTFHPAELAKNAIVDLAVAVAVLVALGRVPVEAVNGSVFLGELSLTGALRPMRGVLPMLRGAAARGIRRALVPRGNAREAAHVVGIEVLVAAHLGEVVEHLRTGQLLEPAGAPPPFKPPAEPGSPDFADIRGQFDARRALEIAAAGEYSLLLIGPPGSAKTMLARRLPTILPPLSIEEAVEVTSISSVAGLLQSDQRSLSSRPFRAPHPTVSSIGLLGGGDPIRPGEVSLAHQGVLFLDEVMDFRRTNLEGLRRILEARQAVVCRGQQRVVFPARTLLVGAVSPCPCGHFDSADPSCSCSPARLQAYRARLRGLFQSFDLHLKVSPVEITQPHQRHFPGEPSKEVRERVVQARQRQAERTRSMKTKNTPPIGTEELKQSVVLDAVGAKVLAETAGFFQLSAEDCARILRVARTIADLDGSEMVRSKHVAEAGNLYLP
jgi:magnesium chelatase family protein